MHARMSTISASLSTPPLLSHAWVKTLKRRAQTTAPRQPRAQQPPQIGVRCRVVRHLAADHGHDQGAEVRPVARLIDANHPCHGVAFRDIMCAEFPLPILLECAMLKENLFQKIIDKQ